MPMNHRPAITAARLAGAIAAALWLAGGAVAAADAVGGAWKIAGRQGILLHVIVPAEQARERDAYMQQLPAICGRNETCFVNFYTNTTGAEVALPLPDAISSEATAVLRRSAKQGVDSFRWSCRMGQREADCF
jgi:hypothetical protein